MTEPGDARKIMNGCDLTADCPADEHASDCWREHWAEQRIYVRDRVTHRDFKGNTDVVYGHVTATDITSRQTQVMWADGSGPTWHVTSSLTKLDQGSRAQAVVDLIARQRMTFVSEDDLQRELADVLDSAGWIREREVRLSDGVSRIDLLVGRVGVEVKIEGTSANVTRQLTRYAQCPEIDELILVTTRAAHRGIPNTLHGKPVHTIILTGGAL